MWVAVRQRFRQFHADLLLTDDQVRDGTTKQFGVRQSLERAYYNQSTEAPPGLIVGSWGKRTAVRPPTDVDIFFPLPLEVYHRVESYAGNKQSTLLQEVKGHLQQTYPQTDMRGDGQVVTVNFNTIAVEIVPVFNYDDAGRFYMPDTNDGGRWKIVDPRAELYQIERLDRSKNGNVRAVAQMAKVWKRFCNVPIKSYQLEQLVVEFLTSYQYAENNYYWYDWFFRDFFIFLCGKANSYIIIPGTGEVVNLGDAWLSRAQTARDRAALACTYEYNDLVGTAGDEWQKIFGNRIPIWT